MLLKIHDFFFCQYNMLWGNDFVQYYACLVFFYLIFTQPVSWPVESLSCNVYLLILHPFQNFWNALLTKELELPSIAVYLCERFELLRALKWRGLRAATVQTLVSSWIGRSKINFFQFGGAAWWWFPSGQKFYTSIARYLQESLSTYWTFVDLTFKTPKWKLFQE